MAHSKSLIGRFFAALGTIFDFARRLMFLLFLLVLGAGVYLVYKGGPPIEVEDGIAMVLVPFGQIVDQNTADPRQRVAEQLLGEEPRYTVLNDMLDAMDAAAEDDRIKLLFLKLDTGFVSGQAQLEELAAGIQRFKASSGKPVHAYAPDLGQTEYFLAAQADRIYIDPMGLVFFPGFENYPLYFAEALDKLGVTVNVFRVGEFKSAVEPFMRNSMSEAARDNAQGWLDGLWHSWRSQVAEGRGFGIDELQGYSDNFAQLLKTHGGDPAQVALDAGLVDAAVPLHEVRSEAGEIVGMDSDHGSFRQIDHRRYLRAIDQQNHRAAQAKPASTPQQVISTVVVQGEIVPGESTPGLAGGDTVSRLIDDARRNKHSAALLLRVESPGGSVFASEQIRRAVQRYRDSGRPVVVSMASVAASGGYWISMNADRILAHGSTITGSIGVFGLIPTFEEGLARLGVHSDGVGTTRWSGGLSPVRGLSQTAREGIQLLVEKDYRQFVNRVAEARQIPVEQVDAAAQGQVWIGSKALELGLVDALGDFDAAVAEAASLAEVADYRIEPVLPPMDIRVRLLERFSFMGNWLPQTLRGMLADWTGHVEAALRRWSDPRGVYAHCLCAR